MYIEILKKVIKTKTYEYILLRKGSRDKKTGKIIKETIANLTNEPIEQVMNMVNAIKGKITVSIEDTYQGKTIGFSLVIMFIMNMLGILKVIGSSYEAKISLLLITARIVIQSSRLQALNWAKQRDYILDIIQFDKKEKDKLNDKTIYLGLDYIQENQIKIEDKLFKIYYGDNPPKRVFYDITSSYVEGDYENSNLATYGYNRDKKEGKKQIVIGLLTDSSGHAISIHTYKGNTNDTSTFIEQLNKLKNRFNLDTITIVGDGGMIKSEGIIKIKEYGFDYITSIGKPSIMKLINDTNSNIDMSLFDEDLKEIIENDTRYILRLNPFRKEDIRLTRESKLERLKEFIKVKQDYYNTHYRAKPQTLENNINKKISDLKLSKFVSYNVVYEDGDIVIKGKDINEDINKEVKTKALANISIKINEDEKRKVEQLDGCYVITSSLVDKDKDTKEDIHKAYKTLIKVENAFKILKTEFLEIRPLYIKTDKRIIGHVALSMLAYNISLKLKDYTKIAKLDFKNTIGLLSDVKTTIAKLTKKVSVNYIPKVNKDLEKLFNIMEFVMPNKVNY